MPFRKIIKIIIPILRIQRNNCAINLFAPPLIICAPFQWLFAHQKTKYVQRVRVTYGKRTVDVKNNVLLHKKKIAYI